MKIKFDVIVRGVFAAALAATPVAAAGIGDERALLFHVDQDQAGMGVIDLPTVIDAGRRLFSIRFTNLDGGGRPTATGDGQPTRRALGGDPFLQTTGPDSGSCAACHNQPEAGGGGDFVVNGFVLAQNLGADTHTFSPEFSNERGTTGMHGSGLIELLAREMTNDMLAIRAAAISEAANTGGPVRMALLTKGVSFGAVTAQVNGDVNTDEVKGVGIDLVVRPWSQKGVTISLREFTVGAMNHHHGMQAVERYGMTQTGTRDFDQDFVVDELTAGDMTAIVLFQASLAPPSQVIPENADLAAAVAHGEDVFEDIGCNECHRTEMILDSLMFVEPGPIAGLGTLSTAQVENPVYADLGDLPWAANLERTADGGFIIRPFTDLKRHVISDDETPFFANEQVAQGFRLQPLPGPTAARTVARSGAFSFSNVPKDAFLTRRLWEAGNSGPFGHRANLSTLNEAVLMHGGEARDQRLAYQALGSYDRASVIEFLRSWRIGPVLDPVATMDDPRNDPVTQQLIGFWNARVN
jgi:mono/diheme cytochrome c family protein